MRGLTILAVAALTVCGLVGASSGALAGERHSGAVQSVDVQNRTILVEELGAAARVQQLHLWIGPQTRLVRSEPIPASEVTDPSYPFRDTPIDLQDLRPGDFVVVELSGDGKRAAVSSVTVTRSGS